MGPTVKSVDLEKPDEIIVSLGLLSASEVDALAELLPELREELAPRWAIKDINILRRNPQQLNQTEILVAVALLQGILKPLGEKLGVEIIRWWKRTTAKKKKRKRAR